MCMTLETQEPRSSRSQCCNGFQYPVIVVFVIVVATPGVCLVDFFPQVTFLRELQKRRDGRARNREHIFTGLTPLFTFTQGSLQNRIR